MSNIPKVLGRREADTQLINEKNANFINFRALGANDNVVMENDEFMMNFKYYKNNSEMLMWYY